MASAEAAAALPPADGQPSAEDDELYRSDAFRMQCMKVSGWEGPQALAGPGRGVGITGGFFWASAPRRGPYTASGSLQEPWGRARRT